MSQFTVDPAAIATAATSTRASGQAISSEVAAMMAHLTLLADTWQGAAHGQFAMVADSWRATQIQVEANLDAIAAALDAAAASYDETEASAVSMFATT